MVEVENQDVRCVDLSCGDAGRAFLQPQDVALAKIPLVGGSACHCKQLCLDHVDEGCRSWTMHTEQETNFWTDGAYRSHTICFLLTVPYDAAEATPFNLVVTGAGLPLLAAQQRVKVVDEGKDCSADPAPTVEGIACSNAAACGPGPASFTAESATWPLTILGKAATEEYVVCYCAGRCGQAAQWVNVSTITVQSAAWAAKAEPVASAAFEAEFTASTFTDRPTDTDEPSTVTAVVSGPTDDECVADGGMAVAVKGGLAHAHGRYTQAFHVTWPGGQAAGTYTICAAWEDGILTPAGRLVVLP